MILKLIVTNFFTKAFVGLGMERLLNNLFICNDSYFPYLVTQTVFDSYMISKSKVRWKFIIPTKGIYMLKQFLDIAWIACTILVPNRELQVWFLSTLNLLFVFFIIQQLETSHLGIDKEVDKYCKALEHFFFNFYCTSCFQSRKFSCAFHYFSYFNHLRFCTCAPVCMF